MELLQTSDKGYGTFMTIKNDLIGRFIYNYGYWEGHLIHLYQKLIEPTEVILDAGANIGFHSIQFGKLGKKVYSYEPQPLVFNLLTTNVLINGLSDKVFPYRLGLSDINSTLKLTPLSNCDESDGSHNYGGRGLTTDLNEEEEVETIQFRFDIDVIKMDIQGSELYALKGMSDVLDRCEPWIMLENYVWADNDKKVLEFLFSKGYTIYRLEVGNNEDCICFKINLEKHQKIKNYFNNNKEIPFKNLTK